MIEIKHRTHSYYQSLLESCVLASRKIFFLKLNNLLYLSQIKKQFRFVSVVRTMLLPLLIPLLPGYLFFLFGLTRAQQHGPVMQWMTAYFHEGEHQIARNALLTTLPNITKEWRVSFDVNPTDFRYSSYASVIHLTIGGKGLGSSAKVGDRIPTIWFHKTRGVLISSALNGNAAFNKFVKSRPPAGTWTKIEVGQRLVSSQYMFTITIGGKEVLSKPNTKPVELSNVKVYAGSPWYAAQKGSVRNFKVDIKTSIDCILTGEGHAEKLRELTISQPSFSDFLSINKIIILLSLR